jgi:hypothetical protein
MIIIMYYSEYEFFLADLRNFCSTGDGSGMNTFMHVWSPFGRRFVAGILKRFFQSHAIAWLTACKDIPKEHFPALQFALV